MLILGDEGQYHGRFPWVTASLIVINVLVFAAQASLGEPFTNGFSLVPEEITTFTDLKGTKHLKVKVHVPGHFDHKGHYKPRFETRHVPIKHYTGPFPIFLTLFTSMFLHGDIFHLIGNMWFLVIFGRNVECAMSHGRFLAFYVVCGLCAGLAHVASDPHSIVPCLGASGAISGVMAAYVSICPFNKIKIWLGFFFGVIQVPALIVIGIWFLLQYMSAFALQEAEGYSDGVAYWNHLGGFTAGFIIIRGVVFYLRRQQARGQLTEAEPLAPVEEMLAIPNMEEMPALSNMDEMPATLDATAFQVGEPDPFGKILAGRVVRQAEDKLKEPAEEEWRARETTPPALRPASTGIKPSASRDPFDNFLSDDSVRKAKGSWH